VSGADPAAPRDALTQDPAGCRVSEATAADAGLLRSILPLLPQLSSSPPPLSLAELERIVSSPATRLLVAKGDDGRVQGMLTLVLFLVPTGMRAWIEDVVVDEGIRRGGVATALVQSALAVAEAAGARTVDLTSRPSREAANRLYQRLGFEIRETNVYRYRAEPIGGAGAAG
jgi:ribosomal protein S18 acetylase RimI-like enzyme